MANNTTDKLTNIVQMLPDKIDEWEKRDNGHLYTPENLYEYINGGAELYISYHFKRLYSQAYVNADSNEIRIDLFDMGSSYNAYGIFRHGSEQTDRFVAKDVESEYASGLLTFWKGRYFVSILAYPESDRKKRIVKKLAWSIAEQLECHSILPPVISKLPEKGLDSASIRYFRHYNWINIYAPIIRQNDLSFNEHTQAVMAKYHMDGHSDTKALFIIIEYADDGEAESAYRKFLAHVLSEAQDGIQKLNKDSWAGSKLENNYIMLLWNAQDRKTTKNFLDRINKK